MRKITKLSLFAERFPAAHGAFMQMMNKFKVENDLEDRDMALDKYVFYWHFKGVADDVIVAEHLVSGPRAPALIWSGQRWFDSEQDFSGPEEELALAIAAQCPGGLAGWS